jgi:hypothetical protein
VPQLSVFEEADGWRYQLFATNTPFGAPGRRGQLAFLEARHRAHARVEDCIRDAKNTGLGRLPSTSFDLNQAWCLAAGITADLLAWLRLLTLAGDLARAKPKTLRYRLLHPRPDHPRTTPTQDPHPPNLALGNPTPGLHHRRAHPYSANLNDTTSSPNGPPNPPGPWNRGPPTRQPGHRPRPTTRNNR